MATKVKIKILPPHKVILTFSHYLFFCFKLKNNV